MSMPVDPRFSPGQHAHPGAGQPAPGAQVQPYGYQAQQVQPYGLHPGYQQQAAAVAVLGKKSAGLAAVLSLLLVGAGQMYCGRVGRGLAFLGAYFVSCLLMFLLIGFLLAPVVLIWALVDSVNLANRHNGELLRRLTYGSTFH